MGGPRKYSLNENYFKEIDTKEKAYILGFIYADGCVIQNNNKGVYCLTFNLHPQDREILEYIKKCLNYSGPIFYNRSRISKRTRQTYHSDILRITSKKLAKDLIKHGAVPRKSLILEAPNVGQEFVGPFIRGYFDGDGCAGLYEKWDHIQPTIHLVGTLNFLTWIKSRAKNKANIRPQQNIYQFQYTNKKSIIPLIELMNESPFGLSRKTEKLDKIMAYLEKSDERMRINHEKGRKTRQENRIAHPEEHKEKQRVRCEKIWKT